jgi:SynChlorMet cassette radical SAM/SPASM protein ScmF
MTPRCGYPLHNLYLYMSEDCNLACRHCWQSARPTGQRPPARVPVDVYLRIVDEAIPLGLGYVKISGGEPLLRTADVLRLVEHTHARGVPTRIETNGTLIDDEVAATFRACGVCVSVSLDGGTAAVHEGLRVIPGCFDATMAALQRLRRLGVPTEIVLSLHRGNLADFPNVVAIARRFGCGLKINPVLASGRGSVMERRGSLLTIEELWSFTQQLERDYATAVPRVYSSAAPAFHSLRSICTGRVAGGHCGFQYLLGVLADGRVSFCGMGYRARDYVFMEAGRDDLDRVWNDHPLLRELRTLLPACLEGVCGNCVMKGTCQGGCRAEAFELYGRITAPSPACRPDEGRAFHAGPPSAGGSRGTTLHQRGRTTTSTNGLKGGERDETTVRASGPVQAVRRGVEHIGWRGTDREQLPERRRQRQRLRLRRRNGQRLHQRQRRSRDRVTMIHRHRKEVSV